MGEELGVGQGPLHTLDQLLLDIGKASDIIPLHIWRLHHNLPHGGGLHLPQGIQEVVIVDLDLVQDLRGNSLHLQVQLGEDAAQSPHARLAGESGEVCSHEAVGDIGQLLLVYILG